MTPGEQLADIFLSSMPGGKGLMSALAAQINALITAAEQRSAEREREREQQLITILKKGLDEIDHHIVGAYEVAHSDMPEPCDECVEMREIAEQALEQYRAAIRARR
jgi:hypothetical protein